MSGVEHGKAPPRATLYKGSAASRVLKVLAIQRSGSKSAVPAPSPMNHTLQRYLRSGAQGHRIARSAKFAESPTLPGTQLFGHRQGLDALLVCEQLGCPGPVSPSHAAVNAELIAIRFLLWTAVTDADVYVRFLRNGPRRMMARWSRTVGSVVG